MKIGYVHSGRFPSNSPGINFATQFTQALSTLGVETHYYVQRVSSEPIESVLQRQFGLDTPATYHLEGIRPVRILNHTCMFIQVYRKLLAEHAKSPFSAVVTRSHTFLPWLVRFHRRTGVPVFFETHDYFTDLSLRPDDGRAFKRNSRLERTYLPRITALLCLQESQRMLYARSLPEVKSYLLRTGAPKVSPCPEAERKYILYVGSLDQHKGLDTVIRALPLMSSPISVLLAGGKNEKETAPLRALSAECGVSDRIEFTGWIDRNRLHRLLQESKLGLLPLEDTFFNRRCTSPLKFFDFIAGGLPIVASDLPTTHELMSENEGWFFIPSDPYDLARVLDAAVVDSEALRCKSTACLRKAEEFSWQNRARRFVEIVQKYAAGNEGRG